MAKQNTSLMLASYTSDFLDTFTNLAVKFSAEAPIPTGVYTARVGSCGGRVRFHPRFLRASFATGVYQYVVPTIAAIPTVKAALATLGATCIDLVGESWGGIPTNMLGTGQYKSTPYAAADITASGDKETGKFTYTSDVYADVQMGYAVEKAPTALYDAQKIGLISAVEGGFGSKPKNKILTPRRIIIKALVDDDTTVARTANIADATELPTFIETNASLAYIFAYQGESARNLQ